MNKEVSGLSVTRNNMNCTTCKSPLGTWKTITHKGNRHYQHECGHVYGLYTSRGKINTSQYRRNTKLRVSASPRYIKAKYQYRGAVFPPLKRLIDRLSFTMKLYVLSLIVLPLLAIAQPVDQVVLDQYAQKAQNAPIQSVIEEVVQVPEISIHDQIKQIGAYHGLNGEMFYNLVKCENVELDPNAQSELKYTFSDTKRGIIKGQVERSYGLAQIHAPDHPEITFEQMTSAEWSLNWMANEIKQGRSWKWKTCGHVAGFH